MKSIKLAILLMLLTSLTACGIYSLDGASIDYTQTKTLSISNFINESGGGPPNLSNTFTEGLKEYFQRRTKLELVQRQGDLQFDGQIANYTVRPQAISSSGNSNQADGTGLMRLTISVQLVFTNTKDEKANIEQSFAFFADYDPSSTTLNAVEDELVDEIFEQLYFDIFQASVAQW
ncbi:LPS assembly lipoprotein LptE [Roseivirga misakiensis]|uniref:Lipopolysaccharide-assembly n=1 Tax=Roseivirga misakiensis TaxID=1563681 RepID=A0A1E5SYV5_9BACT|nr:LptE family protein [Roseivirga misakiensis]OEK04313.1 hypothetical protein BFP71_12585 [Roseivirga misakiensis]